LEVGKRADILCVQGNPAETIEDLRNVSLVLREGAVVGENGEIRLHHRA